MGSVVIIAFEAKISNEFVTCIKEFEEKEHQQ
jgi:hypothetical protein